MKIRKYTDDQVKEYCSNRVSIANKYRFVNFWTFVQLDLIEGKFQDDRKKRTSCAQESAQE